MGYRGKCQITEVGNPFCSGLQTCLCLTEQCAFPPIDGSPKCYICNQKVVPGNGDWKPKLFDKEYKLDDGFWLCYVFCGGAMLHMPMDKGKSPCALQEKCLCIQEEAQFSAFEPLCSSLGTFLCYWDQCELPRMRTQNILFAVGKD